METSEDTNIDEKKTSWKETWGKVWPMIFFLVIGIANAVLMKLSFIIEAKGIDQYDVHKFQKPWWVTMITFFGMALATPIYMAMCIYDHQSGGTKSLIYVTDLRFKDFCEFAIPALSDLFENIVSAVCVVFVGVSIDSMMKSGTLVGVSLISRWVFKVHYPWYKWISIVWVVIALTMVGAAGIINADSSTTITTSSGWVALIVSLKFVSQVGYAVRISYEEYFARVKHYHPVMICGLEGCWSTSISAFVFMPIAQYMPGPEGNGIHEDSVDTFHMLKNSGALMAITIVMIALGCAYNVVSATLISRTSAVVRTLMEAFRTFLIWMVQFIIFYSFRTNDELYPYRLAGEEWAMGSYIQLAGFAIMTFAIFAYNKIPKYPCYNYDETGLNPTVSEEEKYEKSKIKINKKEIEETNEEIETNASTQQEVTADRDIDEDVNEAEDSDMSVRSMSIGESSDDPENPSK